MLNPEPPPWAKRAPEPHAGTRERQTLPAPAARRGSDLASPRRGRKPGRNLGNPSKAIARRRRCAHAASPGSRRPKPTPRAPAFSCALRSARPHPRNPSVAKPRPPLTVTVRSLRSQREVTQRAAPRAQRIHAGRRSAELF